MVSECFNQAMDEEALVKRRRSQLKLAKELWFDDNGSALATAVKRQPSQISDMIEGRKSFGGKVARRLEKALREAGKSCPDYWLDGLVIDAIAKGTKHIVEDACTAPAAGAYPLRQQPTLAQALPVVLDAIESANERDNLRNALLALLADPSPLYRTRVAQLLGAIEQPEQETLRQKSS